MAIEYIYKAIGVASVIYYTLTKPGKSLKAAGQFTSQSYSDEMSQADRYPVGTVFDLGISKPGEGLVLEFLYIATV